MKRAGDPDDRDEDLAAARREFGMTTWQSPLVFHLPLPAAAGNVAQASPDGPSFDELIARERRPLATHFTDGALREHAKRLEGNVEREAD